MLICDDHAGRIGLIAIQALHPLTCIAPVFALIFILRFLLVQSHVYSAFRSLYVPAPWILGFSSTGLIFEPEHSIGVVTHLYLSYTRSIVGTSLSSTSVTSFHYSYTLRNRVSHFTLSLSFSITWHYIPLLLTTSTFASTSLLRLELSMAAVCRLPLGMFSIDRLSSAVPFS